MDTNDDKVVIKIKNNQTQEYESVSQPYINEMLQFQSVQADLNDELAKLGVRTPNYLFASGQMECIAFEDGEPPSTEEVEKIITDLYKLIYSYVKSQNNEGNHLWENIYLDVVKNRNYIKKPDGTMVCIDMFAYYPNYTVLEVLLMRAQQNDEEAIQRLHDENIEITDINDEST